MKRKKVAKKMNADQRRIVELERLLQEERNKANSAIGTSTMMQRVHLQEIDQLKRRMGDAGLSHIIQTQENKIVNLVVKVRVEVEGE
jgi:predicted  nucleic acid-binding Zn-ribbon protein